MEENREKSPETALKESDGWMPYPLRRKRKPKMAEARKRTLGIALTETEWRAIDAKARELNVATSQVARKGLAGLLEMLVAELAAKEAGERK